MIWSIEEVIKFFKTQSFITLNNKNTNIEIITVSTTIG